MNDKFSISFYKNISFFTNLYLNKVYNPVIEGVVNLPDEGFLLVGNHISGYDILLVVDALKGKYPRFMSKKEFFDNPAIKWFMEKGGAFPIDRDKLDMMAVKTAVRLLKENNIVVVFPEGTRSRTGELLPFKKGIASLALLSKVDVVPFGISGEYKFRSKPVIEFGEPISMHDLKLNKDNADNYIEQKVKKLVRR